MHGGDLLVDLKTSHTSKFDSVSVTKNDIAMSISPPDTSLVSSIEERTLHQQKGRYFFIP